MPSVLRQFQGVLFLLVIQLSTLYIAKAFLGQLDMMVMHQASGHVMKKSVVNDDHPWKVKLGQANLECCELVSIYGETLTAMGAFLKIGRST